ncbi:MAG: hypothetical protein KDI07_19225 [Anaerolineae bacterium]|nr:hypothetical protein [Anaerolineae bacterium]MCB0250714.1 hypothetical protein [Anaerolineae bacterium]
MSRLFLLVILSAVLSVPTPRCRITTVRGAAFLVCPCKGVAYVCEDLYPVPAWRVTR